MIGQCLIFIPNEMKQAFIFGWTSLLEDTLPVIHECYLAAFRAVSSEKLASWTIKDTAKRQGIAQEDIWSDEDLWGNYGMEAREAFYRHFSEFPLSQMKPLAREMLHRLDEQKAEIYIVSMKSKPLMLKEVGEAGVAVFARAYFAPDGKYKQSRQFLLKKALHAIGWGYDRIVVMAGAGYKKTAEYFGCEFVAANERNFKALSVF